MTSPLWETPVEALAEACRAFVEGKEGIRDLRYSQQLLNIVSEGGFTSMVVVATTKGAACAVDEI